MAPNSSRSRALHARDAGLRKVSVVTRVFVVASVASAGAFTALAAWAQPGRAKTAVTNRSLSRRGATPLTEPSIGSAPDDSFADPSADSPATSPATTPATAPATAVPANVGGNGGYNLSPPNTVPDPGYQYTGPAVVSGAS